MQHRSLAYFFVFMDLLTSALAWTVFYYLRKTTIEHVDFNIGESFYWGIILIPVLWVLLYYLQGTYHDIKRLYRIKLFNLTFLGTLLNFNEVSGSFERVSEVKWIIGVNGEIAT